MAAVSAACAGPLRSPESGQDGTAGRRAVSRGMSAAAPAILRPSGLDRSRLFRDNTQGGDASHLMAEKFARRITGWYVSRYEQPSTYPSEAPRGPIVAITDEYASSGGDVVIQALKSYGIATVVGTRTWGGVISCYFNELVDGTLVTQPTSALWFADVGWAVENHGVDPDVEVTIAPHDWAAGRDPQLDTAVRLALQALEQRTPATPPTV